jgi:hypothetical protein
VSKKDLTEEICKVRNPSRGAQCGRDWQPTMAVHLFRWIPPDNPRRSRVGSVATAYSDA